MDYEKLHALLAAIDTPEAVTFIVEFTNTNIPTNEIIMFFEYWEGFTNNVGTWIDTETYSFDHSPDDVTSGMLFTVDSIVKEFEKLTETGALFEYMFETITDLRKQLADTKK